MSLNYYCPKYKDFSLSFLIDEDKLEWYTNDEKQDEHFLNTKLKTKLPKRKIFRINSLIFNKQNNKNELFSQYDCLYNEEENSLSILINKNTNFSKLTKTAMINIFDFTASVGIDSICMLISTENKLYSEIIQEMLIVGFSELENIIINENEYKVMKMNLNELSNEVEDLLFQDNNFEI